MRLGIFAKTFSRSTLDGVLDAVCESGIRDVHFNLACAQLESLPASLTRELCHAICAAFLRRGLSMCSVSGTFNAIHPDAQWRREMVDRACRLIERCPELGTSIVTLCTGTRCPDDMWTAHSGNSQVAAWDDLRRTVEMLLDVASRCGVTLGIEPEHANVVNSADRARRLLDEFGSTHLRIVIDAANLLKPDTLEKAHELLDNAFALLGRDIVLAHAKDLPRNRGGSQAAGSGLVDWSYYLAGLNRIGFAGPLVLHGLTEEEVPSSVRYLAGFDCWSDQVDSRSIGERLSR